MLKSLRNRLFTKPRINNLSRNLSTILLYILFFSPDTIFYILYFHLTQSFIFYTFTWQKHTACSISSGGCRCFQNCECIRMLFVVSSHFTWKKELVLIYLFILIMYHISSWVYLGEVNEIILWRKKGNKCRWKRGKREKLSVWMVLRNLCWIWAVLQVAVV